MATQTRTVVFTDLVDYTAKTARSDRESLRRLIERHEVWTRKVCEPLGGRLAKGLGDAFVTVFPSATDALRAAIQMVEGGLANTDFHMRASLSTGDVQELDGDIFGEAVTLASALCDRTPGQQIWFTESTRRCANLAEVPWEPVGSMKFKGIPEEVPCFRAPTPSTCVLPDALAVAIKNGKLVRINRDQPSPSLSSSAHVLFEGYPLGSTALMQRLAALPVLDPSAVWCCSYTQTPGERFEWQAKGYGLVVGTTASVGRALALEAVTHRTDPGHDTVILDVGGIPLIDLVLAGVALPVVPLGGVVSGYRYDLLADGRWLNESRESVLRVEVSKQGVHAMGVSDAIVVNGKRVGVGSRHLVSPNDQFTVPRGVVRFLKPDSQKYCGLFVGDSSVKLGIGLGDRAELGRSPNHPGIALPERASQNNLKWVDSGRAERTRDAGFTLDRALVGRRQTAVEIGVDGAITVTPLHSRLSTYICQGGALTKIDTASQVVADDLIVLGTNVIALRSQLPA